MIKAVIILGLLIGGVAVFFLKDMFFPPPPPPVIGPSGGVQDPMMNSRIREYEEFGTVQEVRVKIQENDQMRMSWGDPSDINTTITQEGRREQWVYGSGRYAYLRNGVVTALQL